jgi:hypothetical protein
MFKKKNFFHVLLNIFYLFPFYTLLIFPLQKREGYVWKCFAIDFVYTFMFKTKKSFWRAFIF